MTFEETPLDGVLRIVGAPAHDERGYFMRLFDADLFASAGLVSRFPQHSCAYNATAGTIRGLHYQAPPHGETKVIRCVRGAAYDVLVDIRRESPTYGSVYTCRLDVKTHLQLYVPPGVAHGYQTLTDDTELTYLISAEYSAESARGIRYDSPSLGIRWPRPVSIVSERDRAWPEF